MKAEFYWIHKSRDGRLAVMPRPRGGDWLEDEIQSLRLAGVDALVSLLTTAEIAELGLTDESAICERQGILYIAFPIADRQVPASPETTIELVHTINALLNQGKGVTIHCRAGIGRSSVIAACVLVQQGMSTAEAFEAITHARGIQVPDTEEQRDWVAHLYIPPE